MRDGGRDIRIHLPKPLSRSRHYSCASGGRAIHTTLSQTILTGPGHHPTNTLSGSARHNIYSAIDRSISSAISISKEEAR